MRIRAAILARKKPVRASLRLHRKLAAEFWGIQWWRKRVILSEILEKNQEEDGSVGKVRSFASRDAYLGESLRQEACYVIWIAFGNSLDVG